MHAYVDVYVLCVCIVGHGHGYTTLVLNFAQSAGAVEYTDWTSEEE